jgi:hypothetical protein
VAPERIAWGGVEYGSIMVSGSHKLLPQQKGISTSSDHDRNHVRKGSPWAENLDGVGVHMSCDHLCSQLEEGSRDDTGPHSHENGQVGDSHQQVRELLVESDRIFPDRRSNRGGGGFCHGNPHGAGYNRVEAHGDHSHRRDRGVDWETWSGSGRAEYQVESKCLSTC